MTRKLLISLLLLSTLSVPAHAGGWCFTASASQSISDLGPHGSGLDASLLAEVHPTFAFGVETGLAYMRDRYVGPPPVFYPVEPNGGPGGTALASVTDGITRNRGYYIGPAFRLGRELHLTGSVGLYELSDGEGRAFDSRWGASGGVGLGGTGRHAAAAEIRVRTAARPYNRATSYQFALGMQFR